LPDCHNIILNRSRHSRCQQATYIVISQYVCRRHETDPLLVSLSTEAFNNKPKSTHLHRITYMGRLLETRWCIIIPTYAESGVPECLSGQSCSQQQLLMDRVCCTLQPREMGLFHTYLSFDCLIFPTGHDPPAAVALYMHLKLQAVG
jgi:hypothetical protein